MEPRLKSGSNRSSATGVWLWIYNAANMYDSRWQEDEVGCECPLSTTTVNLCLSDIKCVIAISYWITSGPTKATAHPVKRSGALQQTTCALVAKAKRCQILSSNVNRCQQSKLGEGGCSDCTQLMMLLPNEWRCTACKCTRQQQQLEMWANAQRGGHPAEYRWRPLFNAAKFGWCPPLQCRAVTLPRRGTHWNYLGCPKLMKRSQPLVGRSSPYCKDAWRRYCCLTSFFPIVDTCLSCEDIAWQSCAMVPRWRFLATFCILYLQRAACSTFQTCILNSH